MGLKQFLLGTPEQRKRREELKRKEREAYLAGHQRARIERARKAGYRAGKTSRLEKISSALTGAEVGARSYMKGIFGDLDVGLEPTRRKVRKKRKAKATKRGRTIVIKV